MIKQHKTRSTKMFKAVRKNPCTTHHSHDSWTFEVPSSIFFFFVGNYSPRFFRDAVPAHYAWEALWACVMQVFGYRESSSASRHVLLLCNKQSIGLRCVFIYNFKPKLWWSEQQQVTYSNLKDFKFSTKASPTGLVVAMVFEFSLKMQILLKLEKGAWTSL